MSRADALTAALARVVELEKQVEWCKWADECPESHMNMVSLLEEEERTALKARIAELERENQDYKEFVAEVMIQRGGADNG